MWENGKSNIRDLFVICMRMDQNYRRRAGKEFVLKKEVNVRQKIEIGTAKTEYEYGTY